VVNDWLDRVRDVLNQADTNDWIAAVIVGALILIVVLVLLRIVGFFFRMASWLVALAAGVAVALSILDRQGVPRSIGGMQIDRWIEDARRWIGV
jgi:purine-cytosine permease-like protein